MLNEDTELSLIKYKSEVFMLCPVVNCKLNLDESASYKSKGNES